MNNFFLKKNLFLGLILFIVILIFDLQYYIFHYPKIDYENINFYKQKYESVLKRNRYLKRKLKNTLSEFNYYKSLIISQEEANNIKSIFKTFGDVLKNMEIAKCNKVEFYYDKNYINVVNYLIYCNTSLDAKKYILLFRYFLKPKLSFIKDININDNLVIVSVFKKIKEKERK